MSFFKKNNKRGEIATTLTVAAFVLMMFGVYIGARTNGPTSPFTRADAPVVPTLPPLSDGRAAPGFDFKPVSGVCSAAIVYRRDPIIYQIEIRDKASGNVFIINDKTPTIPLKGDGNFKRGGQFDAGSGATVTWGPPAHTDEIYVLLDNGRKHNTEHYYYRPAWLGLNDVDVVFYYDRIFGPRSNPSQIKQAYQVAVGKKGCFPDTTPTINPSVTPTVTPTINPSVTPTVTPVPTLAACPNNKITINGSISVNGTIPNIGSTNTPARFSVRACGVTATGIIDCAKLGSYGGTLVGSDLKFSFTLDDDLLDKDLGLYVDQTLFDAAGNIATDASGKTLKIDPYTVAALDCSQSGTIEKRKPTEPVGRDKFCIIKVKAAAAPRCTATQDFRVTFANACPATGTISGHIEITGQLPTVCGTNGINCKFQVKVCKPNPKDGGQTIECRPSEGGAEYPLPVPVAPHFTSTGPGFTYSVSGVPTGEDVGVFVERRLFSAAGADLQDLPWNQTALNCTAPRGTRRWLSDCFVRLDKEVPACSATNVNFRIPFPGPTATPTPTIISCPSNKGTVTTKIEVVGTLPAKCSDPSIFPDGCYFTVYACAKVGNVANCDRTTGGDYYDSVSAPANGTVTLHNIPADRMVGLFVDQVLYTKNGTSKDTFDNDYIESLRCVAPKSRPLHKRDCFLQLSSAPACTETQDFRITFPNVSPTITPTLTATPTPTTEPSITPSQQPRIIGKIVVKSCVQPDHDVMVDICEQDAAGRLASVNCIGPSQVIHLKPSPMDNAVWFTNKTGDIYTYDYIMTEGPSSKPLVSGGYYNLPFSMAQIQNPTNGVIDRLSNERNQQVTLPLGDTVINWTIDMSAETCPTVTPTVTPSVTPSVSPTPGVCRWEATSMIKEQMPNGTIRVMDEIDQDNVLYFNMNNKQRDRHGDGNLPPAPEDRGYRFKDGILYASIAKAESDFWPVVVASPDSRGLVYQYTRGEDACVKLFYDKTTYDIVDHEVPTLPIDGRDIKRQPFVNPSNKEEICGLPFACNISYKYGWILKRKPNVPTPTIGSCPLQTDECTPRNFVVEQVKQQTTNVSWDAPRACPQFTPGSGNSAYWITVREGANGPIVASRGPIKDQDTGIKARDNYLSQVQKPITEWQPGITYYAYLYAYQEGSSPECKSPPIVVTFKRDDNGGKSCKDQGGTCMRAESCSWSTGSKSLGGLDCPQPEVGSNICCVPASPTPTPVVDDFKTQQIDWVLNGKGICWAGWSAASCALSRNGSDAWCESSADKQFKCKAPDGQVNGGYVSQIMLKADQKPVELNFKSVVCSACHSTPAPDAHPPYNVSYCETGVHGDARENAVGTYTVQPGKCYQLERSDSTGNNVHVKEIDCGNAGFNNFCLNNQSGGPHQNKSIPSSIPLNFAVKNNSSKKIDTIQITTCQIGGACSTKAYNLDAASGDSARATADVSNINNAQVTTNNRYTVSCALVYADGSRQTCPSKELGADNPLNYEIAVDGAGKLNTTIVTQRMRADCDGDGVPTAKDLAALYANESNNSCDPSPSNGTIDALDRSIGIKWIDESQD